MIRKMTLWDKILVSSILLINLSWLGLAMIFNSNTGAKTIKIEIYGNLVERISITEDTEHVYSFYFGDNTGHIEVKNGSVRMLEMGKDLCPDSICSKTGWIKERYESIVCMPNGIVISIENTETNQENEIDMII